MEASSGRCNYNSSLDGRSDSGQTSADWSKEVRGEVEEKGQWGIISPNIGKGQKQGIGLRKKVKVEWQGKSV